MRDYGKVFSRIWESPGFRALTEDGRALVLYLLTCQHGTIAGVFRVPDGYASEDLQWSSERVSKGFAELSAQGFANRCETTKWVWVVKYLEWNPPENPNQRKAAAKIAQLIPAQCSWRSEFFEMCGPCIGLGAAPEGEPSANPSGTLSQSVLGAGAGAGAGAGDDAASNGSDADAAADASKRGASRKRAVPPSVVPAELLITAGFDAQTADDFIAHKQRLKAPLTERAWLDHLREAAAAGWTPIAAAEKVMAKSWKGFGAKYVANEPKPGAPAVATSFRARDQAAAAAAVAQWAPDVAARPVAAGPFATMEVIDVTAHNLG